MRRILTLTMLAIIALLTIAADGDCGGASTPGLDEQRSKQITAQFANQERAEVAYPIPIPSNFVTRQQVTRWMQEMDRPQVWYIYVYTRGLPEPLGFYIADAPPTPYCAFLTPPEQIIDFDGPLSEEHSLTAPGLDGVYYSQGDCNNIQYFWDEASGAMVQLKGFDIFAVNAPLDLDVPRLQIAIPEATP